MFWQRRLDSYVAIVSSLVIVLIGATLYLGLDHKLHQVSETEPSTPKLVYHDFGYFTGVEDFKSFIQESANLNVRNSSSNQFTSVASPALGDVAASEEQKATDSVSRYSQTNVQVAGIDEPDIVKTNGHEIFVSNENQYLGQIYYDEVKPTSVSTPTIDIAPDRGSASSSVIPNTVTPTQILLATPANQPTVAATVALSGQLLNAQDTLVVFSNDQKVTGFNVANPAKPVQSWSYTIDGAYVTARLWQNKIYLVVNNTIDTSTPCPIQPLTSDTKTMTIPCDQVYHPASNTVIDSIYSVVELDPRSGQVGRSLSFVGSAGSTTVYMSTNALYLSYPNMVDYAAYSYASTFDSALDLLPDTTQTKIRQLNGYDISLEAKYTELQSILTKYYATLAADQRLRQQTAVEGRVKAYYQQHRRELETTGLTKISLADLTVAATGQVPGRLLNQFSIDEYQGNVRLATTSNGWFSSRGTSDAVNDIYVLDGQLKKIGQLQDLGLGETIYSARFVGERGYLVTFRQTDPFFVLDLSNPHQPELKGELKMPGYSSYLHPLTDTLVLGIGADGIQVKVSLFDVTDADHPTELATQKLDDYWSEAQNNHHAFLQDNQRKVFFLPGSQNGYVFSYADNTLTLAKKVDGISMKRAVYLGNNLYVIGESAMVILDEATWTQVGQLQLTASS